MIRLHFCIFLIKCPYSLQQKVINSEENKSREAQQNPPHHKKAFAKSKQHADEGSAGM